MEPALHHGDELLFLRLPPRLGAVVVARDPRNEHHWIVKRVAAMHDRDVLLASDSPGHESLVVDRSAVIGWAILRYHPRPPARIGGQPRRVDLGTPRRPARPA
jgi:signal peptidase I